MIAPTEEVAGLQTIRPLDPPRRFLFGPGPSMVPPRVYEALAKPVVGYLDPYFFQVADEVQKLLKMVFGTEKAFTMAVSGTGGAGMEAAVANFVEPGMRFAVFVNGFFCERLAEMGKRYGAEVVRCEKAWGETFADDEAAEFIRREKPRLVAWVHGETSTGTLQCGRAICQAAHELGALVIADCVTTLGAMPVNFDETGIDIAYSCSQKGLSCPPGLAPIALSPLALERLQARTSTPRTWYLDLKLLYDYYTPTRRYHHTAPVSMFYALREALALIAEEGIKERWQRHLSAHQAFVKAIEDIGLEMHVPLGQRIWNLNTVRVPQGIDEGKVRKRLLTDESIEILGGFGPLAGKVFRIGIMGPLATDESVRFLATSLLRALVAEGYRPPRSAAE
jgi:alanine-glyoxylate transaminase/serine-glyoxylate transaminase/serine-pyruvate transaminase